MMAVHACGVRVNRVDVAGTKVQAIATVQGESHCDKATVASEE
jgi:hypothetical protein